MSKVTLTLNGRSFTVACDEGQEKRVQYLAQYIDQKLRDVARTGGASNNESYQWLLASLVIADELLMAREELDAAQMDNTQTGAAATRQAEIDLEAVRHLTQRIDDIANKLTASA
jgi:cell division protein ZapA